MFNIENLRESQILYDFTYMWNLKNKINKQTKTNPYREQTDGCQIGKGREMAEKGEGD